jgi:predicted phosphodiesterase
MSRDVFSVAALALVCALLAFLGSIVALRAASPESREVTLGTVDVKVAPARRGGVDVYVPVVDWGLRAKPYRGPVAVELEFRSLDREAALSAVRSDGTAHASLGALQAELRDAVTDSLRRAALLAVLGGVVGALLGGAVIAALGRRRWLYLGPLTGLAVSMAAASLAAVDLGRFDYSALREPTFYAHGDELPRLLAFSERLFADGEGYEDSYGEAVEGLTRLIAVAGDHGHHRAPIDRTIVVASDLHSNLLVLPALEGFTGGKPVFLVGDLTQRGTAYEAGIAAGVAQLGAPVVAVSGNHDSRALMQAAARQGVVVLTRTGRLRPNGTTDGDPVQPVAGFEVAGWDDSAETTSGTLRGRLLELKEQALQDAERDFLAWFAGLPERPDVVLVHRHSLAHALLEHLAEEGGDPVLVLTGHDHLQHVESLGPHTLVDGGSVGAGGVFGLGEDRSGFALVHVDRDDVPRAVDLVRVEPASGAASARRLILGDRPPDPGEGEALPGLGLP